MAAGTVVRKIIIITMITMLAISDILFYRSVTIYYNVVAPTHARHSSTHVQSYVPLLLGRYNLITLGLQVYA